MTQFTLSTHFLADARNCHNFQLGFGANRTCGLKGTGPALAVAVRTEPLGLWLSTGTFEPMLLSWDSLG